MTNKKARVIAFYLPQYHPIEENDKWWGKGFTEWTNVGGSKPLFRGHDQPRIPADLGYYDLRLPEVREEQARMAKEAGVEGFCYYHYWFGKGKRLLERPFNEVLESGSPDYPFCLCWANHTWSNNTWDKKKSLFTDSLLMEQTYAEEDYEAHFYDVLKAFKDERYITVDGKPLFMIYTPYAFKDIKNFMNVWRKLAVSNDLKGIHFVIHSTSLMLRKQGAIHDDCPSVPITDAKYIFDKLLDLGFDAINSIGMTRAEYIVNGKYKYLFRHFCSKMLDLNMVTTYKQKKINDRLFTVEDKKENVYPTILPNWDRSPRAGKRTPIYTNSTPRVFEELLRDTIKMIENKQDEHKIIFLKSWNEWGEGNYVEPDLTTGTAYLDVLRKVLLQE